MQVVVPEVMAIMAASDIFYDATKYKSVVVYFSGGGNNMKSRLLECLQV